MPEYRLPHSQVLQDVLRRVERAYSNFFNRVESRRNGRRITAGFPRFKPYGRYNSITYPQAQKYSVVGGHLFVPKIGRLRVFMHRNLDGDIKTITLKRDRVGDWFVFFVCEIPDVPKKVPQTAIGIDLGLIKLVQTTDGDFEPAIKFFDESQKALKTAQKKLSRKVLGSKNREKARIRVARIHRKIQRQREDFLHKVSAKLVSKADLLVFEDLDVQNMVLNHKLAKSIVDASWGRLLRYVSYKASSAGKTVVLVDPKGTTSDCACGNTVRLSLSDRIFHCQKCGITLDRDLHGSFGTLRKVGWEAAELTPVEMRPLLASKPASLVVEAGSPQQQPWEAVTLSRS